MVEIPSAYRDLLVRPVLAALATSLPDGQVQLHPVWVDVEDGYLRVNTARGRQKDRNLHLRQQATLLLVDPHDPYRYLEVRGRVAEEREAGAQAHIDALSAKYTGNPVFATRPGQTRVIYLIEPMKVTVSH